MTEFAARYGPWALIAGGTDGIGAELARQIAARGLKIVLVARREPLLRDVAGELERRYGTEVLPLVCDLSDSRELSELFARTERIDIGLAVANAALAPIGEFLDLSVETHERLIDLNCRMPARVAWTFGGRMAARGRGGIIILSSMAGFQGTALTAHYAASKAYARVLAEGLWTELKPRGVDVLASCAGIVDTPTYRREHPAPAGLPGVRVMGCEAVARQTLRALGSGPCTIPGTMNRLSSWIVGRLLSRRGAIALASAGTRAMYPREGAASSR